MSGIFHKKPMKTCFSIRSFGNYSVYYICSQGKRQNRLYTFAEPQRNVKIPVCGASLTLDQRLTLTSVFLTADCTADALSEARRLNL